mmetsp:Transcript_36595/g.62836  ORF Transcript_36595/g.62836 Transcript_36595/m.62836 type:complete len:93 (+) Transcript_36595:565-843(+)
MAARKCDQVRGKAGQRILKLREYAKVEHLQAILALDVYEANLPNLIGAVRLRVQVHAASLRTSAGHRLTLTQIFVHWVWLELHATLMHHCKR